MANSSTVNQVEPTRVLLYRRSDSGKKHPPPLNPPSTDFTQKAFLVKTADRGHELIVRNEPNDTDPAGSTSGREGPASRTGSSGTDSGSPTQTVTFHLSKIKSCVLYRRQAWVEITDSTGLCRAVEFDTTDPGYLDFHERLISCMKLLGVKSNMKDGLDRAKWFPIYPPASSSSASLTRELPPVPTTPPTSEQKPLSDDESKYCSLIDISDECPDVPAPSPYSPDSPQLRGRPTPRDDRGMVRVRDSFDNSSNSVRSSMESGGGTMQRPNTEPIYDEDHYLMPASRRCSPYVNVQQPQRGTAQRSTQKANTTPRSNVAGSNSSLTSGPEWNCPDCTSWNPATHSQCVRCHKSRKLYADEECQECRREGNDDDDFARKGATTPSSRRHHQECCCTGGEALTKSKSLNLGREHRGSDRKEFTSAGGKERRAATATKSRSEDCDDYQRTGGGAGGGLAGGGGNLPDELEELNLEDGSIIAIATIYLIDPKKYGNIDGTATNSSPAAAARPTAKSSNVGGDWRCRKCNHMSPAVALFCVSCGFMRHDAWQCQVCKAMIGMDVLRCHRCDVWRCQLCTYQNEARQSRSTVCKGCLQPQ